MEIIKLLKDYSNSPTKSKYGEYLYQKLDSCICREKIKNKNFIIKYLKPINDILIYTTELPCSNIKRITQ